MRILVTGGAGFIGSHLVDLLVAEGDEVLVADSLHPGAHAAEPDYLNPDAEYRIADLRDPDVAAAAVAGADAVCHEAAMVGLGVDFADAPAYVAHNDLATAVLLGALHDTGFSGRLVLGSSMVVYGEGRYRCHQHGVVTPGPRAGAALAAGRFESECPMCARPLRPEPVPEGAATDPRNVYAATKLHQEHLCVLFGREHDVAVTRLRYHNVYGARMPRDTPYAGVASIFRSALQRGEAPLVFEDGNQRRDFVHVSDVARANLLALTCERPVTGAVNVASGTPRTVLEMATALTRAFGSGAPGPEVVGRYRMGDVRHVFASTARARDHLSFEPEVAFDRGMAEFAGAELRVAQ